MDITHYCVINVINVITNNIFKVIAKLVTLTFAHNNRTHVIVVVTDNDSFDFKCNVAITSDFKKKTNTCFSSVNETHSANFI